MSSIDTVSVDDLQTVFGWQEAIDFPNRFRTLSLGAWEMAADDVILRYVFRNFRPERHLEFGTWLGDGVLRCVEECDATVWTINLPDGESGENGEWAYASRAEDAPAGAQWSETHVTDAGIWVRTDAHGLIGRKYLNAGLGHRVCQIYADTRAWDVRHYPRGFFDSAFVDGGHGYDIVANDTRLAIELVRPGGLVMWHDFCPLPEVTAACPSTQNVVAFVSATLDELAPFFERMFWLRPSWLLFGVRRGLTSLSSQR
jgi:methyltransferase family protein